MVESFASSSSVGAIGLVGILLSLSALLLLSSSLPLVAASDAASRAYPLGCLERPASYYTYDERERVECDADADFRRLPSRSSGIRRPYERYELTRKLGSGKFSDVYEAVDVLRREEEEIRRRRRKRRRISGSPSPPSSSSSTSRRIQRLRRRRRRRRWRQNDDNGTMAMPTREEIGEIGGVATVDGAGSSSSGSGGNYGSSGGDYDEYIDEERGSGMTTRGRTDDNGANDDNGPREYVEPGDETGSDPDSSSLVVLKCLKPISERKIRRELLVLTHCTRQRLPNLARLIGIVLPDSMNDDDNDAVDDDDDEADGHADHDLGGGGGGGKEGGGGGRRKDDSAAIQITNDHDELSLPKQKAAAAAALDRRKRRRCPDAPSSSSTRTTATRGKSFYGHRGTRERLQRQHTWGKLPALVLEHAGPESQWLCHNGRRQQRHQRRHDVPPCRESDDGNDDEREDDHLSEREVKYYLCHLLMALDALHAAGIMHRDVKPRNTLINRLPSRDGENDRHRRSRGDDEYGNGGDGVRSPPPPPPLMLVDLGLADFYHPGKSYNVRVASRHYKSPELLIGYEEYDYSVDMWAFGCILVGLLFRREPFFHGKDNDDQLGQIVNVLGIRDFLRYYRRVGRLRSSRRRGGGGASDGDEVNGNAMRLSYKARAAIGKYCSLAPHSMYSSSSSMSSSEEEETPSGSTPNSDMGNRKPWLSFLSPKCPVPSPQGLDLLDKLLVYDHELRWTAREALDHQFFDEVRHQVLGEVQQRMEWESRWRSDRSLCC